MFKKLILTIALITICIPQCFVGGVEVDPSDYTDYRSYDYGVTVHPDPGVWTEEGNEFTIAWDIDNLGYTFHYQYAIGAGGTSVSWDNGVVMTDLEPLEGDLSHLILEVSDVFELSDLSGLTGAYIDELKLFQPPLSGEPGLPGDIFGIKFEGFEDDQVAFIGFYSPRVPEWGDFYAKDGGGTGASAVYAYNNGFGSDPTDPFLNWIVRPDTVVIPEPSTMVILGSSLVAVAIRRRKKKQQA